MSTRLGRRRFLHAAAVLTLSSVACLGAVGAAAQTLNAREETASPLGEFASQHDVGDPAQKGSAVYDAQTQSYVLSGAGENMWFDKDEFHFVCKQMKGDFILQTRARFLGQGVAAHRKLGWMVRPTLDTDAPHINAVVHGDGLTSLQFRRTSGGMTEEIRSTLTGADVIQLERRGDRYTMSVARFGEPFVVSHCEDHELGDEVYVGLFVCSHDPEVIEKAVFNDVRITIPAPEDFIPYRYYLGSRLETLDVDTGDRRVLLRTPEGIEAPNWTPDGSTLIYNSKGRLFRFPLAEKQPVLQRSSSSSTPRAFAPWSQPRPLASWRRCVSQNAVERARIARWWLGFLCSRPLRSGPSENAEC